MTHEKMRAAIEIARQCCSLYSANELAWMRRDGVSVQRLGKDGVEWLIEQKILRPYDDEFCVINRARCIELFMEVRPDEMRQDPRFASDQAMTILKYGDLAERIEEHMRLWIFFREIANAARLQLFTFRWGNDPTHSRIEYKSIPPTLRRDVW